MNISRTLLAASVAIGMIGATTASASAYGTPPAPTRSPAFCDQYAKDYANWSVGNRAGQAAFGGVLLQQHSTHHRRQGQGDHS